MYPFVGSWCKRWCKRIRIDPGGPRRFVGPRLRSERQGGAGAVHANPFTLKPLDAGYQLAQADTKQKDGKCGEAKCGANKKVKEGNCSADKKAKEGSCGADKKTKEGNCGAEKKMGDGNCGANKR